MIGTPHYDNCVEAIARNVEFFQRDPTFSGLQEALASSDDNEIQASLDAMITFSENTHFDEALLA